MKSKEKAAEQVASVHDPNLGRKRVRVPGMMKEIPVGKSLTVPDDSLSVRDFLDKFTRGTAPQIGVNPIYLDGEHDDEDMDAFTRMDFADRQEVIDQVGRDMALAREKYEELAKQAATAAALSKKLGDDVLKDQKDDTKKE